MFRSVKSLCGPIARPYSALYLLALCLYTVADNYSMYNRHTDAVFFFRYTVTVSMEKTASVYHWLTVWSFT